MTLTSEQSPGGQFSGSGNGSEQILPLVTLAAAEADADRADASAAAAAVSESAAAVSAAAALVSENNADADAILTAADAVSTAADAISTAADAVQTALDESATNADAISTAADAVQTALDAASTAADVLLTAADVVSTNADVLLTAADVVSTAADVIASAASAAAALVSENAAAASAASIDTVKLAGIETGADVTDAENVEDAITGSSLDTLSDTSVVPFVKSSVLKKITWLNIKSTLKTYFDSFYLTLSGGTLTGRLVSLTLRDTNYNLVGTVIDAANGDAQYKTLSGNTTFTENLSDGDSVELFIDDGTDYTVTWPTITWDDAAPTLLTTGYTRVILEQMNGVVYGSVVVGG